MSHLTDGQLHAYLDGSVEALDGATLVEARTHLSACDDCSARVEAARLVRDEAASLLGTAAPASFSPPPFEELERRAALVDPAHGTAGEPTTGERPPGERLASSSRLFRRPGSLAWAASLTVALTAGWLARGMVGPGMADRPAVMAPSESIGSNGEQDASALDQFADRDAAESLERSLKGPLSGEEGADDARFRAVETPSAESPSELPSELKEGRNAQATPPPESLAAGEGVELEEESADHVRLDRMAADEVSTKTEPQRAAAKMAPGIGGRPSAGLGAAGPAEWRPVRREQAEALLGGPLKTVEGLPVLSVYARAAGAAPEVWTAQQLASGHQLNLRQTPLGEDPFGDLEEGAVANELNEPAVDPVSEMKARPQGQQQAYYETLESLLVDGFLIEARAPVSQDSLRVLLSRLKD